MAKTKSPGISGLLQELTTFKFYLIAIALGIVGLILLIWAEVGIWKHESLRALASDLGALIFASVAIALIWELLSKRAFLREVLAIVNLAEDIKIAGITKVIYSSNANAFLSDIDWHSLISSSSKIDIMFVYGRTWRRTFESELHGFVQRSNTALRIVLPDPDNSALMSELGMLYHETTTEIENRVRAALQYYLGLQSDPDTKATVQISLTSFIPLFSCYQFDRTSVIALQSHRSGSSAPPAFVLEKSGTLSRFVEGEFEAMFTGEGGLSHLLMK